MNQPFVVFVIAHTPKAFQSPLRNKLFEACLQSLKQQTYSNWQALVISDHDETLDKIHFLKSAAVTKNEKLNFALEYMFRQTQKPDYLVRFDDDDLINPEILMKTSGLDVDCVADKFHHFFDIQQQSYSRQKRLWLANTVIQRYEHAITLVEGQRLFCTDHSKNWHKYYADKKVYYLPRMTPLYLRILSPTSATAGAEKNLNEESLAEYHKYLQLFGRWRKSVPEVFKPLIKDLSLSLEDS